MTNSICALNLIRDGQIVGLGTGRAATAFVQALGERVKSGSKVRGVATSEATATLARQLGIPLVSLDEALAAGGIDVTIDGADEVDHNMDLVKGWGGALVREKIVAAASRRLVILVTPEKLVPAVGLRGKLPVEVIPFAAKLCELRLLDLGIRSNVRQADGKSFITDNGNVILDAVVPPLKRPRDFEIALHDIPGVVGTGLFLEMANDVFVQHDGWVETWHAVLLPEMQTDEFDDDEGDTRSANRAVLRIFDDPAQLSQSAAESFIEIAQNAVAKRGRFTVALAGGSTPKRLYELLAEPPYRDRVDWSRAWIFFGDERSVPADHAESNFRMASETLLRWLPGLPPKQVHRMPADVEDADVATDSYRAEIAYAHDVSCNGSPPAFDLILLGMGADGHTASLFPNTEALDESSEWVVTNEVPKLGTRRMTLTAPLINLARHVMFLIVGQDKAKSLAGVLEGPVDPQRLPSQLIRPMSGRLTWMVDQAAAAQLKSIGPR